MFFLDKNLFKTINEIHVSRREIDTLACLLSGKGAKSIADLLFVSPRTIETHIRAIMHKFGCNSREGIIELIEKSERFSLLKNHYLDLLQQKTFIQVLHDIAALDKNDAISFVICIQKTPRIQQLNTFFERLLSYFHLAGIKIDLKEESDTSLFLTRGIQADGIIYKNEAGTHTILFFLLFNSLKITEKSESHLDDCVNFGDPEDWSQIESGTHYVTFFKILEKITPSPFLSLTISKFKKQSDNFFLDNKEGHVFYSGDSLRKDTVNKKSRLFSFHSHKVFWGIVVTFVTMCIVFLWNMHFGVIKKPLDLLYVRSSTPVPDQKVRLDRHYFMKRIEDAFKTQKSEIQKVVLIGGGGVGKTTLARFYKNTQCNNITWEINAETRESLWSSFKKLAYKLARTNEQNQELQRIQSSEDREDQLLSFVTNQLKKHPGWLLIYDNIENFDEIRPYFPQDPQIWGDGKVIITTQDSNIPNTGYFNQEEAIHIEELTSDEVLILFCKILYNVEPDKLSVEQKKAITDLLAKIPPFPLDVSIAAYYIKNATITIDQYLERITENSKEFERNQESLIKKVGNYKKTRYAIIKTSCEKIIENHQDFKKLLLLISLIDSQNIPKSLLRFDEDASKIDSFIQELKKYSFIVNQNPKEEEIQIFSLHRSTQALLLDYLVQDLNIDLGQFQQIMGILVGYSAKARVQDDYENMRIMISHYEKILNSPFLTETNKGIVKSELGGIYYNLGSLAKSQQVLEDGLRHFRTKEEQSLFSFTQSLVYLGAVYREFGQYEKAKNSLKKGVYLCKEHHSNKKIYLGWVLSLLARTYKDLEERDKAKESLEKSLELYPTLDPSNKNHPCALIHLGVVYCYLGQYESAKNLIQKNLDINNKSYPENNINATWALNELGRVYCGLKRYDEAEKLLKKNLEVYNKCYGESHIRIGTVLRQLGEVYLLQEKFDDAEKYFLQSLEITIKNQHPKSYKSLEKIGLIYLEKSKKEKKISKAKELKRNACCYLRKAMTIIEKHFPSNSPILSKLRTSIQNISSDLAAD